MSTRALRNLCGALWDTIAPAIQSKGRVSHFHVLRQPRDHVEGAINPIIGARSKSDVFANYLTVSRWKFLAPQLHPKRPAPSLLVGTTAGRSRYVLSRGFGTGFMCWQGVPGLSVASTGPGPIAAVAVDACSAVAGERTAGECTQCGRIGGTMPKGIDKSMITMLAAGGLKKATSTSRWGRIRPSLTKKFRARPADAAGGSGIPPGGSGGAAVGGSPAGGGSGRGPGGRNGNNGYRNGNGNGDGDGSGKNGNHPPPEEPTSPDPGILGRIASIHRPTKDQMLAAANGVFARFRIRTKWALIRQMRPYNLEDIAAIIQWLLVWHIIWVVVGTTTFFSIVLLLVNTVYAQESLASMVGNYLTRETGVRIVFESAIVPRWKDGRISLKNVFASRRPGNLKDKSKKNVQKGSSATAAAIAAAAIHADSTAEHTTQPQDEEEEDTNYTQFDVTIDEVAVTLSLARWMNGKGLLKDVQVKGVRGVVDRTHVRWEEGVDPRSYRHVHQPGDFAIESFKLEDLLVTVYEPDGFRPFSVSIYNCELPQLRKQWLFYDFLSAINMSGSFDDSLFTIHPRQRHGVSPSQQLLNGEGSGEERITWKKISRLRIDGLKIDHLNRGVEGPFSWIKEGIVDIVADILFPEDEDELAFSKVVQEIVDRVEKTVASSTATNNTNSDSSTTPIDSPFSLDSLRSLVQSITSPPAPPPPTIRLPPEEKETNSAEPDCKTKKDDNRFIVLDLHIQLSSVRAAVPIFTKDLSYVNSALIRPIVAYINSTKTYIPIQCRVIKRTSEFDGSWTVYDSGLMDDLSAETYEAFAAHVMDRQVRRRRFRKVGLWSLQLMAQAVLMAMAGNLA